MNCLVRWVHTGHKDKDLGHTCRHTVKIRFNYICVFSYFGQDESHVFQLVGQAKPHIMYLTGGNDLMPNIESLAVVPVIEDEESTCSF